MELKHKSKFFLLFICVLLIVPYGIETGLLPGTYSHLMELLIVPYGIETFVNSITFVSAFVF